jgi:hypothetical protein
LDCIEPQVRRNAAVHQLLRISIQDEDAMATSVLYRKWARQYLAHAEKAPTHGRKCRYLQLAVNNTLCARKLEADTVQDSVERKSAGSAERAPTPEH